MNNNLVKIASSLLGLWIPIIYVILIYFDIAPLLSNVIVELVTLLIIKYTILDGIALYTIGGFYYGGQLIGGKTGLLNYIGVNLLFISFTLWLIFFNTSGDI